MEEKIGNKKKVILFVDDDKFLIEMYALKFGNNDYEVHTALACEDALKVIRDGLKPDILLADVVMPNIDGLELVNTLRKENLLDGTVTIMLTNQGSSEDVAKAKKLNVDGYIIKASTIPSEVLTEVDRIYKTKKK